MHALNKCNSNKPQFKMQDIMNYDWELKFKKKKKKTNGCNTGDLLRIWYAV